MNPKVDFYFNKAQKWQEEVNMLRTIIIDCNLNEELKWGCPCYTFQKKNVILIHGFKEYCAVLFIKGVLLQDAHGVLIQQTEYVQAARQIRFTNVGEIIEIEKILKEYIYEAIEIEKAGLQVILKKNLEPVFPDEFKNKIDEIPSLKDTFASLTPGRQRAYLIYFAAPKQSKTREARIEKWVPQILKGKGLND